MNEQLLEHLEKVSEIIHLPVEYRQVLHYLVESSDENGLLEHPEGKSVSTVIGDAVYRHPLTVYRYLRVLEKTYGLVRLQKHEKKPCHGRHWGHCVVLLDKDLYKNSDIKTSLALSMDAIGQLNMEWLTMLLRNSGRI